MKTTIRLFSIVLAFLSVTVSPTARAVCQDGCDNQANTFLGGDALLNNTSSGNTAVGNDALLSNTTGYNNTAVGIDALLSNTTAIGNTALGALALRFNTTGSNNVTVGCALDANTTGSLNTAIGAAALGSNTTGNNNMAVGFLAGDNLIAGNNDIYVGNPGFGYDSRKIRIGTKGTHNAAYIAGIFGATVADGVTVVTDNNGHLGTIVSSARYKDEIKPIDKASEAILALKPVTFRYKKEIDPNGIAQFGLVAEEVEKVNPDLVARDQHGKPYSVRYEAVNAMLLNEFLKEHRKNEKQEATIARLEKQVEALTAGLQKVSAQLEMSTPVLQTIANNQ